MRTYDGVWHKRHLLPSWILQFICAGILGIIACLLLVAAGYVSNRLSGSTDTYYGYTADELVDYAAATGGVILALCVITYIFNIVEIVLYARRKLSPVLLLVFASLKTLVWGALFVLCIVSAARGSVSAADLILAGILAVASALQLVFAARFTHQKRKGLLDRGHYAHAAPTAAVESGLHPGLSHHVPDFLTTGYDSGYRAPSPVKPYDMQSVGVAVDYHAQDPGMQQQQQQQQQRPAYY